MDKSINNNYSFYEDIETNFKQAYDLCQKDFSHMEILDLLKNGNIPQKQIAALKFDYINNIDDAKALLENLTGCDGKIREAVALKINSLLLSDEKSRKIFADISAEKFADATIDINANICRLVVDSAIMLKDFNNFSVKYTECILQHTKDALNEIDKFIFRDKKYVINKQIFKLYWCLEALSDFFEYSDSNTLSDIIVKCASQSEYTIREKIAKIIQKTNKFESIKEKLANDENYYVREMLHHPSFF